STSASAFVFKESPEPGLEMKLPSWDEKDQGKKTDQFKDLGGSWEVLFTGSSKAVTLNLEVVKADTSKYADASTWVRDDVIGLRGHVTDDAFMAWYSHPYDWSYGDAVETPAKLQSGEPATVFTLTNLKINSNYPKVAFIAFGRGDYWYCVIAFNDNGG